MPLRNQLTRRCLLLLTLALFLIAAAGLRAQDTWFAAYDRAIEDIAAGRWQEAAANLQAALRLKPRPELNARTYGMWRKDYLPHYYLGLVRFNLGEYDQALEEFKASREAGAVQQVPDLFEHLQDYERSIQERRSTTRKEQQMNEGVEAEITRALEFEQQGDLEEAYRRLESALIIKPGDSLASEHLKRIEVRLKSSAAAVLSAEMDSLLNAGNAALERGDTEEAAIIAESALAKAPGEPRVREFQQAINRRRQQLSAAADKRAQQLDSLLLSGREHFDREKYEEADTDFNLALKLDPRNRTARLYVTRIDSLLAARERLARQSELIQTATGLLALDSLISARDCLVRARELGDTPLLDSLMAQLDRRLDERNRISRERDLPQVILTLAPDSIPRVRQPKFNLRGTAFDNDGLSRILLVVNGSSRQVFPDNPSDTTPLRASFEQTIGLSEGLNNIEVVIYDKRQNSFIERRKIYYLPPFWRRSAFITGWMVLLILSGGGYYYYRRNALRQFFDHFRRRPFELIQPNPFIVGNPIRSSEMFFGREDDFRFVKNKVDNEKYGSLIVLFGERRAGKTSVLYQMLGGRLGPSYLPVFIDMQAMAVNDDWEFLGRMAELTVRAASRYEIGFDLAGFEDRSKNPYVSFERFIDRLLETIGQDKLLFLVDEYELIEDKVVENKISKDIFLFLSGLVEHKAGLFLIFAGTHRLQERGQDYWQNLLQRCDYRNISYLTANDTRRLIQEPVAGQVFYLGASVARIMRLTAGQPFYTQLFCRNTVEFLNEEQRNYFYEDDIAAIVREIVDNPPPQMIYFWAGLNGIERLALSATAELCRNPDHHADLSEMAEMLKKHTSSASADELKKAADRLMEREVLEQDSQRRYRFRLDLLRHWIREEHNLHKVLREFEPGLAI